MEWYDKYRQEYRPTRVEVLLIAESPPDPKSRERRFFYSPELRIDNLFRSVARAVLGDDVSSPTRPQPSESYRSVDSG